MGIIRKIGLWLLWQAFIVYSLFLAPPLDADLQSLKELLTGQLPPLNIVAIAVFSSIGMWIMIYSCVLFADGRMQQIPAWPFLLGSLGTGVISLIPYLALREQSQVFVGPKDSWLRFWDSRLTAIAISVSTAIFIVAALLWGDWSQFFDQLQTSRFIHVMSLALCLFTVLFPTVLGDDMARRGLHNSQWFWPIALVPLAGPLIYLCWRPALPEYRESQRSHRAVSMEV